ncbi:MAG TPA: type II toxin-antitoxin system Phd/YefM family antitoxin [Nitrococcus sp.]|nr:type II toxin-antitoxin system Phd/YefM family antitoxin [Nitrococcus sp.]
MLERFTPSRLRANLYRILDRVLETGRPVEIQRKGRRLRIVAQPTGRLDLLKPHPDYLRVPAEEIVHLDWLHEWRP